MVDFGRASTDPSADLPASGQEILHDIEHEQGQADEVVATQVFQAAQGIVDPSAQVFGALSNAVAVGNGYQFSPEEIQQQIAQCQDLVQDFKSDSEVIRPMIKAVAPAPDQASGVQIDAVRRFGGDLEKRNQSQSQFLHNWVQALTAAKQRYLLQEQVSEEQWDKLAKGPGG